MKFSIALLFLLSLRFLACAQTECPSCDKYLASIYDEYKIVKKVSLKEDFKQWFFSDRFEKSYKNNNTSLDITIPIEGVPITFGGSHESEDAWQKRETVRNDQQFSIDYSTFESIYIKKATPQARDIFLSCVKACYDNAGSRSPVKVSLTADKSFVFVNISYNYQTGASIPVFTSIFASGVSEIPAKPFIGQMLNTGGTIFKLPWNGQGETEATITINTTRGVGKEHIFKSDTRIQISYKYETVEKELVGQKSVYMQNPGCSNCGCNGRPCYGGNGATIVSAIQTSDPNNWLANARFVYRNTNAFVNILPPDYLFGMPPNGLKATKDSATVVGLITHGWGPGFDGDFIVDVFTNRKLRMETTRDINIINNVAYFSVPKKSIQASIKIKDISYDLNDDLENKGIVKKYSSVDKGIENEYTIEFLN